MHYLCAVMIVVSAGQFLRIGQVDPARESRRADGQTNNSLKLAVFEIDFIYNTQEDICIPGTEPGSHRVS